MLALFRWALRGLWFGLIPLLLSGLALRYLVPHASSATGLEGMLALAWRSHGLLLALVLFLALVALIRYWRNWLPGASYLSTLPSELALRVPRRRIASCEAAVALLNRLKTRAAERKLIGCSADVQATIRNARAELEAQLNAGKWSKVARAQDQLEFLLRPVLDAQSIGHSVLFLALLLGVGLLALQVREHLVQAYEVIGNSMLPTLTPEQVLVGRPVHYTPGRLPHRGELVVLRTAVDGREQELIKRVVGLPGDRIGMWGVHPTINGWSVPLCDAGAYYRPDDASVSAPELGGRVVIEFLEDEAYLTFQTSQAAPFPEYVVKPGEVFVMGDNRSSSRDSRTFDQGAPRGFPVSSIRAQVSRVLFSRTRRGEIEVSSVLRPLRVAAKLDGADMSAVQARIDACLAVRPQTASPPRAASAALALHD